MLEMLTPPSASRPRPSLSRCWITAASLGWLATSSRPESFSYQRKAGTCALAPCSSPAWLAGVVDGSCDVPGGGGVAARPHPPGERRQVTALQGPLQQRPRQPVDLDEDHPGRGRRGARAAAWAGAARAAASAGLAQQVGEEGGIVTGADQPRHDGHQQGVDPRRPEDVPEATHLDAGREREGRIEEQRLGEHRRNEHARPAEQQREGRDQRPEQRGHHAEHGGGEEHVPPAPTR